MKKQPDAARVEAERKAAHRDLRQLPLPGIGGPPIVQGSPVVTNLSCKTESRKEMAKSSVTTIVGTFAEGRAVKDSYMIDVCVDLPGGPANVTGWIEESDREDAKKLKSGDLVFLEGTGRFKEYDDDYDFQISVNNLKRASSLVNAPVRHAVNGKLARTQFGEDAGAEYCQIQLDTKAFRKDAEGKWETYTIPLFALAYGVAVAQIRDLEEEEIERVTLRGFIDSLEPEWAPGCDDPCISMICTEAVAKGSSREFFSRMPKVPKKTNEKLSPITTKDFDDALSF